jgi:hypothetical protein
MLPRPLLAGLVLTAALLTGCSPAGKLVGKWEADMSGVQSQIEKSGNPLAGALAGMMSMLKVEAEFKADGTCTIGGSVLGQSGSNSGTWRYVKTDGSVLVVMVKGNGAEEKELRLNFVDNDHFEMVPPEGTGGGQKLPFVRVKAK